VSASPVVRLRQLVWIVLAVGAVALDSDYVIFIAALVAIVAVAIETRTPIRALGLSRPRSIARTVVTGIVLGLAMLLFSKLMLTEIVERITGIPRDLSAFDFLRGDAGAFFRLLPLVWLSAAFGEEIVFRGFLIGRLEIAFGGASRVATAASVVLSTLLFAFAHAYQGPTGIVITGVLGFVFAVIYVACGRNLWINILAHGVYDTGSFLLVLTSYDRVFSTLGHRIFG
jgi:membrane protease YdiL (CAAX protease family)